MTSLRLPLPCASDVGRAKELLVGIEIFFELGLDRFAGMELNRVDAIDWQLPLRIAGGHEEDILASGGDSLENNTLGFLAVRLDRDHHSAHHIFLFSAAIRKGCPRGNRYVSAYGIDFARFLARR